MIDRIHQADRVRYIAFLRGINMIGSKVMKMHDLRQLFLRAGLDDVETFLATGNVAFWTAETNPMQVTHLLEQWLANEFGYHVHVFLRTVAAIRQIVDHNPFGLGQVPSGSKAYLSLLPTPIDQRHVPLVLKPKNQGYTILHIGDAEIYSLVFPLGNGRYGNPTGDIEKELGVLATTRNWTTISRIARTTSQ